MHIPSPVEEEETPSCKVEQGVEHRSARPPYGLHLAAADTQSKEADMHRAVVGWHTWRR